MGNTKPIDRTKAHVEKKNHLKINRPGDRNYKAIKGWKGVEYATTRQLSD